MVLGYHVIITACGFWLPNDSRGSWSDFVAAWELLRFGGKATKVGTRKSVAGQPHDVVARLATKQRLKYPAVTFTGIQARAVGRGFANVVAHSDLTIWACSILPEHVHLVIRRHRYEVEKAVNFLKGDATRRLKAERLHPLAAFADDKGPPTPWAHKQWKVFLDSFEDIRRAIRYVQDNPEKEGKPRQEWAFVRPFEG